MKSISIFRILLCTAVFCLLFSSVLADKQQQRRQGFDARARTGNGYRQGSNQGPRGNRNSNQNAYKDKAGQKKFNHNWSALDRELFLLNDQLKNDVLLAGTPANFYSWLDIPRKASMDQITKAYKRLSRQIHPDKVNAVREKAYKQQQRELEKRKLEAAEKNEPLEELDPDTLLKPLTASERKKEYKLATDRFTRLGLVYKILNDVQARERYDFFLDHGFPKLKGADYFYSRYRPGVGFVLVFIYLFVGVGHYVSLRITSSQHRRHMSNIISDAKELAWPNGIPASTPKTVIHQSNGKIFRVYPNGSVSLLDDEGGKLKKPHEFVLDLSEVADPHWKDTLLFTIPQRLFRSLVPAKEDNGGRKLGKREEKQAAISAAAKKHVDAVNGVVAPVSTEIQESDSSDGKPAAVIKGAAKVGGRRRK